MNLNVVYVWALLKGVNLSALVFCVKHGHLLFLHQLQNAAEQTVLASRMAVTFCRSRWVGDGDDVNVYMCLCVCRGGRGT